MVKVRRRLGKNWKIKLSNYFVTEKCGLRQRIADGVYCLMTAACITLEKSEDNIMNCQIQQEVYNHLNILLRRFLGAIKLNQDRQTNSVICSSKKCLEHLNKARAIFKAIFLDNVCACVQSSYIRSTNVENVDEFLQFLQVLLAYSVPYQTRFSRWWSQCCKKKIY